MTERTQRLRQLADEAEAGEPRSSTELLPLVYDELRDLARARIAKLPPGQTLQATDLVHETYMRVAGREPAGWNGRRHFLFAAARSMRDLLIEDARRKASQKRGAGFQRITLSDLGAAGERSWDDLLALDDALNELETTDPENYQVVMLRYFGGLDVAQVADATELSLSTVKRKWRYVRAWLLRAIDGSRPKGDPGDL